MERLTFDGNFCDIAMCRENPCPYNGSCSQREVWERLKAYEQTGLTPEMLQAAFTEEALLKLTGQCLKTTPDRLLELVNADREGRLAVLPCKFGDSLYRIRRFKRGSNWKKEAVHIMSTTLTMNNVANVLFGDVMGKTVFLTRDEAAQALKNMEETKC